MRRRISSVFCRDGETSFEIIDDFAKSRHSRAGGNAESVNLAKRMDSRFHGMTEKAFSDFLQDHQNCHHSLPFRGRCRVLGLFSGCPGLSKLRFGGDGVNLFFLEGFLSEFLNV